ncbi:hypothetical protein B14_200158 (plasmid) [Bacillus licheniformis]|uniref:hypothetical protein n=1 Tax=Bacillus licheniformis TaxID=1402 RepID=UPI0009C27DA4|nr:hypothetical protein [Bacillus licheniformis]ARC67369.1 hypothetical protein B14_200158 [Bacillus licheniformis]ARW46222.1 hypothetical protein S100141_05004 [Bacillus licheniformis]MDE1421801.1 hypothetical protein [Bacillus licheniformis]MEC0475806.1 hypothetical protein [Bacillus licheniformis]
MSNESMTKKTKRIGNKRNFMLESQAEEMNENDKIVKLVSKTDKGIENIDLILEPNKFEELSSLVRLSYEEYIDVINELVDAEEAEWDELRMKDQVNITRDAIIQATILKYAEKEYGIDKSKYSGISINYDKRYDKSARFIGEAITVTLTAIALMGVKIK